MTVVSGVPNDMIAYGDRVAALDLDLQRRGYHLEEVLSRVRGLQGAPPVPALGDELNTSGKRYLPIDGKVRAVGHDRPALPRIHRVTRRLSRLVGVCRWSSPTAG